LPRLGLVRTSLVFGILNAAVGLWGTWVLQPLIKGRIRRCVPGGDHMVLLAVGVLKADR